MTPAIVPLLQLGSTLIERLFPDPEKKAAAELELLKLTQDGELKQILAQLEINAKEAAHPSLLVAGWRPATGWVCLFGLLYSSVLHSFIVWIANIKGWPVPPPVDADALTYLLYALLGVGSLRTVEKVKKVTK